MSKDIPVIFSAPMVRALLEGRKTMTRRVLKPQPQPFAIDVGKECEVGLLHVQSDPRPRITLGHVVTTQQVRYAVGDRLYVRENHRLTDCECPEACRVAGHVWYDADESGYRNVFSNKLRPSIHMPRWASRLTLIVTGVKVERLQDITEADAEAEGVYTGKDGDLGPLDISARSLFGDLWRSIHGPESASTNPFVLAVTFRVIKTNIDAPEARLAA